MCLRETAWARDKFKMWFTIVSSQDRVSICIVEHFRRHGVWMKFHLQDTLASVCHFRFQSLMWNGCVCIWKLDGTGIESVKI